MLSNKLSIVSVDYYFKRLGVSIKQGHFVITEFTVWCEKDSKGVGGEGFCCM